MTDPDRFMTTEEVAAYLRVARVTLGRWRREGSGPPWSRPVRRILYLKRDLDAWVDASRTTAAP
jgi:predicted site-specific integrase-resolvase